MNGFTNRFYKSLIIFIILSWFISIVNSRCGVHLLKDVKMVEYNPYGNESELESKKRFLTTTWQSVRIHIDYTTLDAQESIDLSQRNRLKQIMNQTIELFSKLLKVKPLDTPLKVNGCGGASVSQEISTNGKNIDIIIIPVFDENYSESVEAAAAPCMYDVTTMRPVMGFIKWGLKAFKTSKKNWLEYFTVLGWHEISHIFVMHETFFERFIDESGNKIPKDKVIGQKVINGVSRSQIIIRPSLSATIK